MPKLSVIITSFNLEEYIAQTLQDIINQSLRDIEIIVVDDGSSDQTPKIIRDFAEKDSRIRTIYFENNTIGGVASAANAGLREATGDYIGFADGDDRYDSQMFEKLWRAAVEADADLAMCNYEVLNAQTQETSQPADMKRWQEFEGAKTVELDDEGRLKFLRFIAVPWRKIYRRELIAENSLRFPEGDFFFEDNPFHWSAVISARNIAMVPEVLCAHRVARSGQTMASADEKLLRIFFHHDIIRDWLLEKAVYAQYKPALLGWVAAQLSWVSKRAEGDMQRLLFDRLVPVVQQYSGTDIADFQDVRGNGPVSRMIAALHQGDFAAFGLAAGWKGFKPNTEKPSKAKAAGKSTLRKSLASLRASVKRTAQTFSHIRTPSSSEKRNVFEVRNEDLMAAMVLLQREIKTLRAENRDMKASLAEIRNRLSTNHLEDSQ